jgi:oligogalacturonide lyase
MINRILGACALAISLISAPASASDVGKRFPSEMRMIVDRVTGAPLTVLTSGAHSDAKIYPTHPQWTHDNQHIVFRSGTRAASQTQQVFLVNEITGVITQITDGPGVQAGGVNVARRSNKVYYMRQPEAGAAQLIEIDLDPLLRDSAAGTLRPQAYERIVATMPADGSVSSGFAVDADERSAYVSYDVRRAPPRPRGQPVPQVPGGIRAVDIASGRIREVVRTPFRIGHIQANPIRPGEIMYCHETGGDAPQRMWVVNADGTGNRALYKEGPEDWVTHEQFADADHVIFNLMGHTRALRQRPTGIIVVSLRDGTVENLGQTDSAAATRSELPFYNDPNIPKDETNTGGYWHNGVTYDRRFAAGDDFDGAVHLIDRRSGQRTMLTTGHRMRPDHAHPSFHPDGSRILLQSGMLTDGARLSLMTVPVPAAAR